MTDREADRGQKETHMHAQKGRQGDRETGRQGDREAERQRGRETGRQRDRKEKRDDAAVVLRTCREAHGSGGTATLYDSVRPELAATVTPLLSMYL